MATRSATVHIALTSRLHKEVCSMRRVLTLATVALGLVASPARADIIVWSAPQDITGDADVVTAGTTFGAVDLGNTTATGTTVNGVHFAALGILATASATSGNFQFNSPAGSLVGGSTLAPSGLSPAYQLLFTSGINNTNLNPISLTISSLTPGNQYEFEWWNNAQVAGGRPTTATAGNSVSLTGNPGQFATGTFTADSTSQVITFGPAANSTEALTAVQLRDLGPASVVPAPSSLAALGMGVATLAGYTYRRRRKQPLDA
jgi:hypothetical protein